MTKWTLTNVFEGFLFTLAELQHVLRILDQHGALGFGAANVKGTRINGNFGLFDTRDLTYARIAAAVSWIQQCTSFVHAYLRVHGQKPYR